MSATESTGVSERARDRPALAAGIALAAIVVVSALIRTALNWSAPGPWIFVDELIYSELGKSAFDGTAIRGLPVTGYGPVYPYLIAPAYALFENLVNAYQAVKVINAVAMSLVAIPVYFTARKLMSRRSSLMAAALSILVPGMAYTSVVMTENAFYPIFALAIMCMMYALVERRLLWQIAVFPVVFVLYETRAQGAIVLAAYGIAVLAVLISDAIAAAPGCHQAKLVEGIRRFWFSIVLLGGGLFGLMTFLTVADRPAGSLLGAYAITAEATERYQWRPILSWFLMHVSEFDLWLGVIPFVALFVLFGAASRRIGNRNVRVFACMAVPVLLVMCAVVAAFVVFSNVGRIEERNLFYVGVFPLISLCWWIDSGLERPRRWFAFSLALGCLLPIAIPYGALINQSAASDTFGIYLPWAIQNRLLDVTLTTYVIVGGMLFAAALLVLIPQKKGFFLAGAVIMLFLATNYAVNVKTDKASAGAVKQGVDGPRDWIDAALGSNAQVTVLYSGGLEPLRVWENEFFNRSIGGVLAMGVPIPDGLPQLVVNPDGSGQIVNLDGAQVTARYVLVHDSTVVAGTTIANDPGAHLSVVQAEQPLRLRQVTLGVYDDGWTGGDVTFRVFECEGGVVRTTVRLDGFLHKAPVMVTPKIRDQLQLPVMVPIDGTSVAISVPVTPTADGMCEAHFLIDPLAVPQETDGSSDTRALGVLMTQPILSAN